MRRGRKDNYQEHAGFGLDSQTWSQLVFFPSWVELR